MSNTIFDVESVRLPGFKIWAHALDVVGIAACFLHVGYSFVNDDLAAKKNGVLLL
jgi:hypothetical protein